jgi:hypothetical protein
MSKYPYIESRSNNGRPHTFTVFLDSQYTVDSTHPKYKAIIRAVKNEVPQDDIVALINSKRAVERISHGALEVTDYGIFYNGTPLNNVVVDRILLSLQEKDKDVKHLLNFLDRLMMNPIESAREELYLWLETSNLPICEDGCFLAYKNVRSNYKDIHSGRFDNSVGAVMPYMSNVDTDRS